MVCFDANDMYIGEFNGKQIHELYHHYSLVPHKHDAGGQSQRRFERGRNEALKHWMKEIAEKIEYYQNGRTMYLGCNSIYKNRLKKYLNPKIVQSIISEKSVSIDDNCLWEIAGLSRYE